MRKLKLLTVTCLPLIATFMASAELLEFKEVDANADGILDQQEFANSGAKSPFEVFDTDENGRVSKKEYEDKLQECE